MNIRKEKLRLELRKLELAGTTSGPEVDRLKRAEDGSRRRYDALVAELQKVRSEVTRAGSSSSRSTGRRRSSR